MKKIKVAHILNAVGGVETYFRHIVDYIDQEKFESIVICNSDYIKLDENKKGIKIFHTSIQRDINPILDFKAIRETIKILQSEKPDIIHCHSSKGGLIGRLSGNILNIPSLYTPNAFSFLSSSSNTKKNLYKYIERLLFSKRAKLLACSISELNRGRNDLKLSTESTILWNNSIPDESNLLNTIEVKIPLPNKYICFVGRPSYQKNIESLILILKNIQEQDKNINLVLMGIGHYSPNLESVKEIIKEENLSNKVTLIPWTDRLTILKIISKSICYISTARYEGLPYSVIESLSLGVPCVVTCVDGNKDLIQNDFNGFVVEEGNEQEMANKVLSISQNDSFRQTLSKNARKSYLNNYNLSKNILLLEHTYETITS